MLWEQFVTDGHVRAARLRYIAIPLVIIGVILILLARPPAGLLFVTTDYSTDGARLFSGFPINFQDRAAVPVIARLKPPPLKLQPDVIKQLAPASELDDVGKMILDSLKANNSPLPKDLPIKDVSAEDFWAFNWSSTDIVHFQKDNFHVFGAMVTPPPPKSGYVNMYAGVDAVRWVAIFRQDAGQWRFATIADENRGASSAKIFFVPPDGNPILAEQIPATLRHLMGIEEFQP